MSNPVYAYIHMIFIFPLTMVALAYMCIYVYSYVWCRDSEKWILKWRRSRRIPMLAFAFIIVEDFIVQAALSLEGAVTLSVRGNHP